MPAAELLISILTVNVAPCCFKSCVTCVLWDRFSINLYVISLCKNIACESTRQLTAYNKKLLAKIAKPLIKTANIIYTDELSGTLTTIVTEISLRVHRYGDFVTLFHALDS